MNIEKTKITKIFISNIDGFDDISVYLEDLGKGKGSITINVCGDSFASYWGAMGARSIAEFFCSCDPDYLISNLASEMIKYEPDFGCYLNEMRKKVCEMRRDEWISKDLAREIYDVQDWSLFVTDNPYEPIKNPCLICSDEFEEVGFDGFDVPERITSDWLYLRKVIKLVKSAIA